MKTIVSILLVTSCITATFAIDLSSLSDNYYYSNRLVSNGDYLWIASDNGIIMFDKQTKDSKNCNALFEIEQQSKIVAVSKDNNDNLFISTKEYNILELNEGEIYEYYASHTLDLTHGYAMAFDSNNTLWTSNTSWLYNYNAGEYTPQFISFDTLGPETYIMDMDFDSNGYLWVVTSGYDNEGGRNGYLYRYNVVDKTLNCILPCEQYGSFATSISIDNSDNIWFLQDGDIHLYNQTSEQEIVFSNDTYSSIGNNKYTASDIDDNDNKWFISSNNLLKYNNSEFISYTTENMNDARAVICDDDIVWVFCNDNTLLKFENEEFTSYTLSTELYNGSVTGVKDIDTNTEVKISIINNGFDIKIDGVMCGEIVNIYNTNGVLQQSFATEMGGIYSISNLTNGIYIVNVNGNSYKIIK